MSMDKETEKMIDKLWEAIYDLQNDINQILAQLLPPKMPNTQNLNKPKPITQETIHTGLRKAIEDSRKQKPISPIVQQTKLVKVKFMKLDR